MGSNYSVYIGEVLIIENEKIKYKEAINYCFKCSVEIETKHCHECGSKAQFKNVEKEKDVDMYETLEAAGVEEDTYQVDYTSTKIYLKPNWGDDIYLDKNENTDFKEIDNSKKDWEKISIYLKNTDMKWEIKAGVLGNWS